MQFRASRIRFQTNEDNQCEIILTTKENPFKMRKEASVLKEITANGKELSVEVKPYRKKRSLDANALLWKMCNEIAIAIKSGKDEVYLQMLERYGVFTHIIVKPEAVEKIKQEWRTVKEIGEVTVNGRTGYQLQCYYGSHLYDSKEFGVLLDGVISEAKELGIEVINESDKQLLLMDWGKTA